MDSRRSKRTYYGYPLGLALTLSVATPAFGGVFEFLSRGVHYLSKGGCESFDETNSKKGLKKGETCLELQQVERQMFWSIKAKLQESAEDQLFTLLAKQSLRETNCGTSYLIGLQSTSDERHRDLVEKMKLLRSAKQELISAAKSMSEDPDITDKTCPLSLGELKPDPYLQGRKDKRFEMCRKVISSRVAYDLIMGAIPLSEVPAMRTFLESFAGLPSDDPTTADAMASSVAFARALQQSELFLENQKGILRKRIIEAGGFNSAEKHQLLADPRLVEDLIRSTGNDPDVRNLLCRADASYGSGRDELDANLTVASFILTGGAGLRKKFAEGVGPKLLEGVLSARAAGLVSLRSARILELSALGLSSLNAYNGIDSACFTKDERTVVVKNSEKCLSAPKAELLEQENCVLGAALEAIEFRLARKVARGLQTRLDTTQPLDSSSIKAIWVPAGAHVELVVGKNAYNMNNLIKFPALRALDAIPDGKVKDMTEYIRRVTQDGRSMVLFNLRATKDEVEQFKKYLNDRPTGLATPHHCVSGVCKALQDNGIIDVVAPLNLTASSTSAQLFLMRALGSKRIKSIEIIRGDKLAKEIGDSLVYEAGNLSTAGLVGTAAAVGTDKAFSGIAYLITYITEDGKEETALAPIQAQ